MENKCAHVVIFSSGQQYSAILRLSEELQNKGCQCTLWTDLFTRKDEKSKYALLPILLKKIPTFDFAIILATPDDSVSRMRDGSVERFQCMRDNVIFEIGLCTMGLGTNRAIILQQEEVHLFDDLIGVSGIGDNESLLLPSALGIKCFTYTDNEQLFRLCDDVANYIDVEMQCFSPIVIGAACSTAIGYYNMFMKRMVHCLLAMDIMQCHIELRVLVPYYINDTILREIKDFYEQYGFEKRTQEMNVGRDISFYCKIENDTFVVCDIPTSIGASYDMARDILSIEAADIMDADSEKRFLMKEANMFYLTLKRLIASEPLKGGVDVVLQRIGK